MKLSIVTPSYNQGEFIRRTIESVLTQGCEDLEYIVMDGGSSDNTVEILQEYGRAFYWESKKDKGQADAVNQGIRKAKGDIIGWLNSDDIYYPGAFDAVMDYFTQNPDVNIVYGNAYHIDSGDNVIEEYYTEDFDFERLKDICYICQPSLFFRRSIVDRYGYLDDRLQYCMDYDYWLRLAKHEKFARIDNFIAGSRLYDANKTLGSRVKVHDEIAETLKRHFGKVPRRWLYGIAQVKTDAMGIERTIDGHVNYLYEKKAVFQAAALFIKYNKWIPLKEAKHMIRQLARAWKRRKT